MQLIGEVARSAVPASPIRVPEVTQCMGLTPSLLPRGPSSPHAIAGVLSEAGVYVEEEDDEYDPLRDGPLRFCGYANELGEAFAAWLPFYGVPASYGVAILYVLVDTFDKTIRANQQAREHAKEAPQGAGVNMPQIVSLLTSERAVDTLLWQMLASVAIPGFTIHQVVYCVHLLLVSGLHLDDPERIPATAGAAIAALASMTSRQPLEVCATPH